MNRSSKGFSNSAIDVRPAGFPPLHRVLFMPESASLAHVGRLLTLASALPRDRTDCVFACDPHHRRLVPTAYSWRPATSHTPDQLRRRLARGEPLLTEPLIRLQVEEDMSLMRDIRPHLVVGDFRPSLSISATLMGIPYLNITNALWSPWARECYEVPGPLDLWWCRMLGARLGKFVVDRMLPVGFVMHGRAFNRVRRHYGLAPVPHGLRGIYTAGDYTGYTDLPELTPTPGAPLSHRHIGPVMWEPTRAYPPWWNDVPRGKPCVYVSVGSTGDPVHLGKALAALEELSVTAVVATSGRVSLNTVPGRRYVAESLPGLAACRRADAVICNGGSGSVYQALSAGVPVLGMAANMDQALVMAPVERAGAGRRVLAGMAKGFDWKRAIKDLLETTSYRACARQLAGHMARRPSGPAFRRWVDDIVGVNFPVTIAGPLDNSHSGGRGEWLSGSAVDETKSCKRGQLP